LRSFYAVSRDGLQERARRNVRSLIQWNQRESGLDQHWADPRPVESVGIVGAGVMGTSIAAVHVRQNVPVVITDVDEAVLDEAPGRICRQLSDEMPFDEARDLVGRMVNPTLDNVPVRRCDLVVEAIAETVSAKQQLYARLQPLLSTDTTLASNTSTIPIGRLASSVITQSGFCGMHFFHPVLRRPLVEIVRGPETDDQTIATVVAHAKAIDKMPVVVEDGPGFLVNRLLLPYLGEAFELLLEGAEIEAIERAATDFGMAKGPLRLADEIGLDTVLQAGLVLREAFPERIAASPLLIALVKKNRLGQKSGKGFFSYVGRWGKPDPSGPDKDLSQAIARWARPSKRHTPDSITTRLLLPMVLEATRILDEGKVRDPRDIDLAVLFGLGFPASRGGLFWWADGLGAERIIDMLAPLRQLGPRCRPTPILRELARHGGSFYRLLHPVAEKSPDWS